MSKNSAKLLAMALLAASTIPGCHDFTIPTEVVAGDVVASASSLSQSDRHVVVFTAQHVPPDFVARVEQLGAFVERSLDSIGVAIVTGLTSASADALATSDVRAVEPDVMSRSDEATSEDGVTDGQAALEAAASFAIAAADASVSPTAAQFYARQWNMGAVFVPEAWAAGHLGSRDVVVAILDSGIDYLHPDMVGLVDLERSKSFVPEDVTVHYPGRLAISDLHNHGTFVASIVGSNASVTAGINRFVTLLAVDSVTTLAVERRISVRAFKVYGQP